MKKINFALISFLHCAQSACVSVRNSDDFSCCIKILSRDKEFVGKGPAGILVNRVSKDCFKRSKSYFAYGPDSGEHLIISVREHFLQIFIKKRMEVESNSNIKLDVIFDHSNFVEDMSNMPDLLFEESPDICNKINNDWIIVDWNLSK
jgi:hypothetical protein